MNYWDDAKNTYTHARHSLLKLRRACVSECVTSSLNIYLTKMYINTVDIQIAFIKISHF